ncbi:uncharacterized protein LOC131018607 [Salvia miltiorrhiza]|uniref:uncharacterized protein LOC131018607 n=1 Tax=Salvia miltiorrhiza TaxID=226208 RepID=UPI0025ABCF5B|nr:uncharacterized protein LOC131018607 [Salvia miltiorrhiza]
MGLQRTLKGQRTTTFPQSIPGNGLNRKLPGHVHGFFPQTTSPKGEARHCADAVQGIEGSLSARCYTDTAQRGRGQFATTLKQPYIESVGLFSRGIRASRGQRRLKDTQKSSAAALSVGDFVLHHSYIELLKEFKDIFAWSYKERLGLRSKIDVHHLAVRKDARPVKQAQRRFRPELVPLIEAEVNKLIDVGFIREVKYPTWISSIVPGLDEACPKDDFSLPIAELMIDATTGHEALTFMDGSFGYNQIRMSPNDEELTVFRTPKEIYCYKVMPFGLKNVGATYQRAMQKIFDDILHKIVQCYVDDLVVKSKKRSDHLQDLRMVFERLRKHQLKMNPLKCAFGIKSGKFLGFIVRHQGIEIEQAKIDAIIKMLEPQNIHDLKSLQGKLAYLRRFISNLAGRCQPFSRIMKKAPMPGRPLILYIAAQERSMGALLAQENEGGKENTLYYLSRTMTPNELKYTLIEKLCLALIFSIQKLKHYFQAHTVRLVSKVLADFLADHPIPAELELSDDLPDEDALAIDIAQPWWMFFDGASHREGVGAGIVFVSPERQVLPYSFTLTENCSNNVAEYQALILGLEMTLDMQRSHLKVYGDSKLAVNQILGLYEVKKPELLPYVKYARKIIGWLGDVELEHIPRNENKQADALAKLVSTIAMVNGETHIPVCERWVVPPIFENEKREDIESHLVEVFEIEEKDWRQLDKIIRGHLYILVATDYFSKWAEAVPLREVKKETIVNFIKTNIIYRYGVPRYVITDNGTPFSNALISKLCEKFGFKQRKSSMYNALANGSAEAFNKTLCNMLKKIVSKSKRDWHERIGEALWAYRTTYRTPTQATPYSLVNGVEAVIPLEQQIPSLRMAIQEGLTEEENARLCQEELEALDEKRLEAQQKLECYQARLSKSFNKTVRVRFFQVGDLVLAVRRPIIVTHRVGNKFVSRWDGPYVVKEVYTNRAYMLLSDDNVRVGPINGKFLKRYYP